MQALLQAERALQRLSAKEGKPVGGCVLGMVFMGPHIDAALASQLFRSLEYYRHLLPCLWSLYELRRLLGCHMRAVFCPETEALLSASAVAQLAQRVRSLEQQGRWCTVA